MKKCKYCNIDYNTERYTCPFCKNLLEDSTTPSEVSTTYEPYPKFKDKIYKINLLQRIFLFISLLAIIIVVITNYYEYKEGSNSLWSVISLISILTIWVFIKGLILSKRNAGYRILLFGLSIILLFLSIEYCSVTSKGHYSNWSLTYVIPFILIGTLSSINLIICIKKKKYSDFIGSQFGTSLLCISYYLFVLFNVAKTDWPSLTCLLYGILTIIAMFFFGGKTTKEELKKRFIF